MTLLTMQGGPQAAAASHTIETDLAPAALPSTGVPVWDQALGGFAPGMTVLLAGEPSAGKTTLALKLAQGIGSALIVSSEEDPDRMRAHWAKLRIGPREDLLLMYEADVAKILAEAARVEPRLLVVNSLNTTTDPRYGAAPDTSFQLRAVCRRLVAWTSTRRSTMTVVAGHVTWDNRSSGPRMVEHEVDAVAYLTIVKQGEHVGLRQLELRKGRPPFKGQRASYLVPNWEPAHGEA